MITLIVDTNADNSERDYATISAALAYLAGENSGVLTDDVTIECYQSSSVVDSTGFDATGIDLDVHSLRVVAVNPPYIIQRFKNYGSAASSSLAGAEWRGIHAINTGATAARGFALKGSNQRVINCLGKGAEAGIFDDGTGNIYINPICFGSGTGFYKFTGGVVHLYNPTICGNTTGIDCAKYLTHNIKNGYVGGNTTDLNIRANTTLNLTTSAISDESCAENAELMRNVAYATDAGAFFTNITPGYEDFNINAGSVLIGAGTDLSEDAIYAFNFDANGNTRSGAWSIGAYQFSGDISRPFESSVFTSMRLRSTRIG